MTSLSMLDVAYEVLQNQHKEMAFIDLWNEVVKALGYNTNQAEQKIAQFYSALMLDVRFAQLHDNLWDLRSRRTYSETYVDTSSIIVEEEYLTDDEVEEFLEAEEENSKEVEEEE